MLLGMQKESLVELGFDKYGDRFVILKAISTLQDKHSSVSAPSTLPKVDVSFSQQVKLVEKEGVAYLDLTEYRKALPEGKWPFTFSAPYVYVRDCYPSLFERIMHPKKHDKTQGYIVTGTPGIGKTVFLTYALYRLLNMGKRVFLTAEDDKAVYEFLPEPQVAQKHANSPSKKKLDIWYLYDSATPNPTNNQTSILAACPKKLKKFSFFRKDARTFYAPIWTFDELRTVKKLMYADQDDELFRLKYRVFGGSARILFKMSDELIVEKFGELKKCNIDAVIEMFQSQAVSQWSDASHLILHMAPTLEFNSYTLEYASPYMEKYVQNLKGVKELNDIANRLSGDMKECITKAQMGIVFEHLCILRLQYRAEFTMYPYKNPEAEVKHLGWPHLDTVRFETTTELENFVANQQRPTLYKAINPRNAGFDAVVVVGEKRVYLNMTVGNTHGVSKSWLDTLPGGPKGDLVYLKPRNEREGFRISNPRQAGKKLNLYTAEIPQIEIQRAFLDEDHALENMLNHMTKTDAELFATIQTFVHLRYTDSKWEPVIDIRLKRTECNL